MKMQESPEDYLETIYMLSLHSSEVRSIDVARHLGYSKPSVSVAMKRLRENGYVNMDDNNLVDRIRSGHRPKHLRASPGYLRLSDVHWSQRGNCVERRLPY